MVSSRASWRASSGFNEAAASMLRKAREEAQRGNRPRAGFNEAAASMLRKATANDLHQHVAGGASMRPQHRCCGKLEGFPADVNRRDSQEVRDGRFFAH